MSDCRALAHWQNTLREVLTDYVNGNFLRVRVKWTFPFTWGISAYAAEHALRKLVYAAYPLANQVKSPTLTAYLDRFNSWPPLAGDPEMALLAALTQGYRLLSDLVSHEQGMRSATLAVKREFEAGEYQRIDRVYFSPVVHLTRFIRQQMRPYLSFAVIHGSIGDLKYAKGYSDLDTWLVIDESTATNAERLRQFAKRCYRSLTDIYRFDPLQHHGHMIATAIDLRWYSENWLPVDAFRHACSILSSKTGLEIFVRDSALDARRNFEELEELMRLRRASQWSPETAFDLKDYLSILMLAPALYLQAKGLSISKQDSFRLAREHLPNANWDALNYATQARSAWPHYRSSLLETVPPPNVSWANFFQRKRVREIYRSTLESFPITCLNAAAELTQQMADDVERSAARLHALKSVHDDAELPLSIVNRPLVREARDYDGTRDRYLALAQQENAVLGVYQYGNITYPGLSDLDLVLCLSETAEPIESARLAVTALSPLDQDIMLHSPAVVPVSQIPYLHELLTDSSFQKVWGDHDLLTDSSVAGAPTNTYAKAAKLFEKLFSYRIWISEVLSQRVLDARWAIPTLKSVAYSCALMGMISGDTLDWASDYQSAIQELRANWFLEDSQSRQNTALRTVFRHSLQVIVNLMAEFDFFVQRSGWFTDSSPRRFAPVSLPLINATLVFREQFPGDWRSVIAHPRQIDLPGAFGKFLYIYAQAVDNSNRQNLAAIAHTEFESYLHERVKKIGQQMRFLKRHHMNYGGYLPGQLEQFLNDIHYDRIAQS